MPRNWSSACRVSPGAAAPEPRGFWNPPPATSSHKTPRHRRWPLGLSFPLPPQVPKEPDLASQPETQSGVRPGQALPSPLAAPRERRRGPPLKRMCLSARLSGSRISLGFQPPKQAVGTRGPPAAGPEELRTLAHTTSRTRGSGPSTATAVPTPTPLQPLPTEVVRALVLTPILRLRNLRPNSKEWREGWSPSTQSSVLCLPAPLPRPPAVLSSRCVPGTVLGEGRRPEGPFPKRPVPPQPWQ